METHVISGVVSGLIGGGVVATIGLLSPRRSCPECSAALPRVRMPSSIREAMFGGWVCKACGTRVNYLGQREQKGVSPDGKI